MTAWIEDWFGSSYYALLYKHRDCDEAKVFIDNLITLLKLSPDTEILDCGCGRGRHSIYLNEKKYKVTGIDISEQNIDEAKKHENENLIFYIHDMRNFFRINYYDSALCAFTSFGYYEKDSENNKTIKAISSAIKKDGFFVLDFMNVLPPTGVISARVITSPGHFKRITRALQENLARYEQSFGQITEAENPSDNFGFQTK